MMRRALVTLLAIPFFVLGCSSGGDSGSQTDDAAGDPTDTAVDETATDDTGTPDTAPAPKPATPSITGVMAMSGGLHVSWKLNDTGLASVELWRKEGSGAYAKAYTLAGTTTSKMDSQASNHSSTYCYQLKTIKAGVESDLSNEKCGSP